MSNESSPYLFVTCQVGAEAPCKSAMAKRWPDFRFAFSRPGFLTFKLPPGWRAADFDAENPFARAYGESIGKIRGEGPELIEQFWKIAEGREARHIHVWQRDPRKVGDDFAPYPFSPAAREAADRVSASRPAPRKTLVNHKASAGDRVIDCIIVEEGEWWIGEHVATSLSRCWPGGIPDLHAPADMISRAYLKTKEALLWSQLPIRAGDRCAEIGCAPGGTAQALLEMGLEVIGVDPAEIDPRVAEHARFNHIRMRGRDVRRSEFSGVRWLLADANVAPKQTLDTIGDIVTHESVRIQGMLLTIKMPEWKLADDIPEFLKLIRAWGFNYVKPRHLAFNRQEICIAALRRRSQRRFGRKQTRRRRRPRDKS